MGFWWSIATRKRTFYLFKGHDFSFVIPHIEVDEDFIWNYKYRVDEAVNNLLSVMGIFRITSLEFAKEQLHEFWCNERFFHQFLLNIDFKFLFLLLQFFQALLCRRSENSLLDCIYQIVNPFFHLLELRTKHRQPGVFFSLKDYQLLNQCINRFFI